MTNRTAARLGALLDAGLSWIAGVILFIMMILTSVDVFTRYVLNSPIRGAFEISEILMAVLIFAGLPLVSRKDEHVTIEFADKLIPGVLRGLMDALVHLACAAMLFGAAWLMWLKAQRVAQYGDNTATLKIELAPFVYLMCALILVTALIHLVKAFQPGRSESQSAGLV